MEMHFELLAKDFLDKEKLMEDFFKYNRDEFLALHHKVSEQDWEITYAKLMAMLRSKVYQAKYL
tara:strand:- start:674 stop:865 length:192 start_codon:yes stop_codon:yes gene_type:complete